MSHCHHGVETFWKGEKVKQLFSMELILSLQNVLKDKNAALLQVSHLVKMCVCNHFCVIQIKYYYMVLEEWPLQMVGKVCVLMQHA